MNYTLNISLQGHATNASALSFVGKQITIIAGAGAGQTATITAYDARTGLYTLDQNWATSPDAGSEFQISEGTAALSGYHPVTGSYGIVLTSQPTPTDGSSDSTVYVDATPQPTTTYNADNAFDPNSNYGQNAAVQVRVQATRALFLLSGLPGAGQTWSIILNDQPFSIDVTGKTLGQIAQLLVTLINGQNGYSASLDPSNGDEIVVERLASPFYAAFQISHDAGSGEASVSQLTASGITIAFSGTPSPGEQWTLKLDATHAATNGPSCRATRSRRRRPLQSQIGSAFNSALNGTTITVQSAGTLDAAGVTPDAYASARHPGQHLPVRRLRDVLGQPVTGQTWKLSCRSSSTERRSSTTSRLTGTR